MSRAVRLLFAASVLLLLSAVVALGVRGTQDGVPTALPEPTTSPSTGMPTDPDAGADDPMVPSEPATTPTADDGIGDGTGAGGDGTGAGGTDGTGASGDGDTDGSDDAGDGTDAGGAGEQPTGTDGEPDDGDADGGGDAGTDGGDGEDRKGRSLDDMPSTGGGAATALGGLVALGAGAGILRRR